MCAQGLQNPHESFDCTCYSICGNSGVFGFFLQTLLTSAPSPLTNAIRPKNMVTFASESHLRICLMQKTNDEIKLHYYES
jgi:hypothetical protein